MEMLDEGLPRAAFERDAQEEHPLQAYLEVLERRADATGNGGGASATTGRDRAHCVRSRRWRPVPDSARA